ncbi:SGNH/GDSL hydrolase family protein [Panacibacter sp. DH6]|uniref:SGNH/GDSL hydrolase family protein n=1 Tax=Panacibacter microcysteis TaxID=2793269 RepID=A0A931E708_9BACT|nr:SGNH/GDSL hydrolase family protein [Panacibacter microcysteis]MBG9376339.1 SGNH/GDSL hydrolase family protein [Panacibacter microcysteis]
MTKHIFSLLALGDSYTIGEGVPVYESFPYQAVQMLRKQGFHFHAPELVAKTGWTTFELAEHILHTSLNEHYDFVTLLIGVNNQYRNLNAGDYKTDVEFLLKKAIHFAGERSDHVIVLSIPDWGVTPFAKEKDTQKIAMEIDEYNRLNKQVALQYNVHYLDITTATRSAATDSTQVTADGLHPSGKVYAQWAQLLAGHISKTAGS